MNRRSQSTTAKANSTRRVGADQITAMAHAAAPENAESSRQEIEGEIALYRHALEKAREDFQAFAYSVSHDLRAPLRAIEGFSRILTEDFGGELSKEPRRFLDHIISNSQQLSSQIEDLLKFYRAGKNPPTKMEVDSDRICREALTLLDGQLLKKVSIVQHELPLVVADSVQLREIFSELLVNALKFSAKMAQPKIEIGAKIEPGATSFYVRDNGVGFDLHKAERLFQVFQKLHNASDYPGNGIGLAIAKRLVEAHGGCISADAQPGKGAVFCFSLPNGTERVLARPTCVAIAG